MNFFNISEIRIIDKIKRFFVILFKGKLKNSVDPTDANSYSLLYNEYIVYDVSQIKLRYLVKIEFDYDMD